MPLLLVSADCNVEFVQDDNKIKIVHLPSSAVYAEYCHTFGLSCYSEFVYDDTYGDTRPALSNKFDFVRMEWTLRSTLPPLKKRKIVLMNGQNGITFLDTGANKSVWCPSKVFNTVSNNKDDSTTSNKIKVAMSDDETHVIFAHSDNNRFCLWNTDTDFKSVINLFKTVDNDIHPFENKLNKIVIKHHTLTDQIDLSFETGDRAVMIKTGPRAQGVYDAHRIETTITETVRPSMSLTKTTQVIATVNSTVAVSAHLLQSESAASSIVAETNECATDGINKLNTANTIKQFLTKQRDDRIAFEQSLLNVFGTDPDSIILDIETDVYDHDFSKYKLSQTYLAKVLATLHKKGYDVAVQGTALHFTF